MFLTINFLKKSIAYYKVNKIITRYKIIFKRIIKMNVKIINKIL